MKQAYIVIGTQFGDEGKGATVNYLCSKVDKPLVVRFSGGHQVGHTVHYDGKRHVFSNFGAGTLRGVPTYWSEYCTVNPLGVMKESRVLGDMNVKPEIYFNPNALVTTPLDIIKNRTTQFNLEHGSVGVGFGTTIQRNEDNYRLYVRDLKYPKIRDAKINSIMKHYYIVDDNDKLQKLLQEFREACDFLVENYKIIQYPESLLLSYDLIFEGSQGILLDMEYGFYPNVTRSYTTSRNALEILEKHNIRKSAVDTYYITRAYQTRHGNGFMTNEDMDLSYIKENPFETNKTNAFQGHLRKGVVDVDLINYALECEYYHNTMPNKHLVITCLDQVPEKFPVMFNGELRELNYEQFAVTLGFARNIYPTYSDKGIV